MEHQQDESVWLEQLERWNSDGTLKVIDALQKSNGAVRVRRSDGSFTSCVIFECGFGGRAVTVMFNENGPRYKLVHTEDFIEQNKELFPWVK